jgi:hypothetical protein
MNYTAKQLITRAKNLADIRNTDFLDYIELTQYINDSFITVYNWLIQKGDTQFIKEVELTTGNGIGEYTEYELPKDLYIIKSIKNPYSGHLIPRHAESEGINSGSYDVVNDRLRLYGVASNYLVVTYWIKPPFISFPDEEVTVSNNTDGIISSAGNSVLFDDGSIWNLKTNESLGSIIIEDNHTYVLGNGHVFDYTSEGYKYRDYKGQILYEGTGSVANTFYTDKFYVAFQLMSEGELTPPILYNRQISNINDKIILKYGNYIIAYNGTDLDVYYYDEIVYSIKTDLDYSGATVTPISPFNNHPSFILKAENRYYMVVLYERFYDVLELDIEAAIDLVPLKYGLLHTDGTNSFITSWTPDTEMNFPNEMYFSLIACDLALRFLMKQNADGSSVQALYQDMKQTFMNSLSQASDGVRIKNVYN